MHCRAEMKVACVQAGLGSTRSLSQLKIALAGRNNGLDFPEAYLGKLHKSVFNGGLLQGRQARLL